jgi:hypothetical protein
MSFNKFIPTPEALAVAREMASALGDTFDEATTSQTAFNLLEIYFNDVASIFPAETASIHFEHLASRDFAAFITPRAGHSLIFIDQQLDCFLFSAFFSNSLLSCHVFEANDQQRVVSLFQRSLMTYSNPYHHEVLRGEQKPYFLEYPKDAVLANSLVLATVGFVLCHEIAHHHLGHFEREQTPALEHEADALGFYLLSLLTRHHEHLPHLRIAPNKLGAPILALTYLAQAVSHAEQKAELLSRAERLRRLLEAQSGSEDAFYLLDGFMAGIPDPA